MIDVLISVAHHEASMGAVAEAYGLAITEYDWSGRCSKRLANLLTMAGFQIQLIGDMTLDAKIDLVNEYAKDHPGILAIEIHFDSVVYRDPKTDKMVTNTKRRGPVCEVWGGNERTLRLATSVTASLAKHRGGAPKAPIVCPNDNYPRDAWVRLTACDSMLVEVGKGTNPGDAAWLNNQDSPAQAADAICSGLCAELSKRERRITV